MFYGLHQLLVGNVQTWHNLYCTLVTVFESPNPIPTTHLYNAPSILSQRRVWSLGVAVLVPDRLRLHEMLPGKLNEIFMVDINTSYHHSRRCVVPSHVVLQDCRVYLREAFWWTEFGKPQGVVTETSLLRRIQTWSPLLISESLGLVFWSPITEDLTLSLLRMINVKFPLQPHQKYYITQYGELDFS